MIQERVNARNKEMIRWFHKWVGSILYLYSISSKEFHHDVCSLQEIYINYTSFFKLRVFY